MKNQVLRRKFTSAYQVFLSEQIKLIKPEQRRKPGLSFKIIGQAWRSLGVAQKQHYQELFKQAESEFQAHFHNSTQGTIIQEQTTLKMEQKKPPNVYILFLRDKRLEYEQQYPTKKYNEIRSMISQEYKKITKEEKEPYEKWRDSLMKKYNEEKEYSRGQSEVNQSQIKQRSSSRIPKPTQKVPQKLTQKQKKPQKLKQSKSQKEIIKSVDQSFQSKSSKSVTMRRVEEIKEDFVKQKQTKKIRLNIKKKE